MTYCHVSPGDTVRYLPPEGISNPSLIPGKTYTVEQVHLKMGGNDVFKMLFMIMGKIHDATFFILESHKR